MAFKENMRVVVFVFAELSWRRWLCVKKSRRGTAIDKKNGRRSTREGARRGRAGAMRVVAAVRILWMCGTKKCPCEFATEGASMGSEKRAAK